MLKVGKLLMLSIIGLLNMDLFVSLAGQPDCSPNTDEVMECGLNELPGPQMEVNYDPAKTELVAPVLPLTLLSSTISSIATSMKMIIYYLYFICCGIATNTQNIL